MGHVEPSSRRLYLADPDATRRLGRALGETARPGDLLLLSGELGAGKTTLTQGIAEGLGLTDRVTSPTFALLHTYDEGRIPLHHFDLYRLSVSEIEAEDFPSIWEAGDGLAVIEWAERLEHLTPRDRLVARLEAEDDARAATLTAVGDRPLTWLDAAVAHAS